MAATTEFAGLSCTPPGDLLACAVTVTPSRCPAFAENTLGPFVLPAGCDTLTCVVSALRGPAHDALIEASIAMIDRRGATIATQAASLTFGDALPFTFRFAADLSRLVSLHIVASCRGADDPSLESAIDLNNVVVYTWNPLVQLFNDV